MKKRARLEIERAVDVVLGAQILLILACEHILKDGARRHMADALPNRFENVCFAAVRDQPLPKVIILRYIVLEVVVAHCVVIAPRIASEDLVAASAREHYLDELSSELGGIENRIGLADPRLLEMPDEPLHDSFHVARLEHHLVVLGLELV